MENKPGREKRWEKTSIPSDYTLLRDQTGDRLKSDPTRKNAKEEGGRGRWLQNFGWECI